MDVKESIPSIGPYQKKPMDIALITQAIAAASASVGLIDKISDQISKFVTGRPDPTASPDCSARIKAVDDTLQLQVNGETRQTITGADLAKLPPDKLRHITVLQKAMENHYEIWAEVYPQRKASSDPIVVARTNQQLKGIIEDMRTELNGILQFLEDCGMSLDDHYMYIRDLVNRG